MEKWNIVLLNLTVDKTISGVNRYMELLSKGLSQCPDLVVHQIVLLQKKDMLLYSIQKKGESVVACIMLPVNMNPIVSGIYWMDKYAEVVADLLLPYFLGMEHLIWHTHCINLSQLAVLLKKGAGGNIVTHLHCIPWKFAVENNPPRFNELYWKYQERQYDVFKDAPLENLTYRISDHIICVTSSGKDYLSQAIQVSPERVSVVYNGAEDVSSEFREPEKTGDINILYVGRISKEKGVPDLLEALLRVKKRGYHFKIILVGSGNKKLIETLREKYSCLKPDFRGQLNFEEVKMLYKGAAIGIIPSLHEQCSYVAIEMAMFGLPMIVTDVDGLGEIFTDGVNALKVPCLFDRLEGLRPDVTILAKQVMSLIDCHDLRVKLGHEVRKLYIERFSLEQMVKDTVEIYIKTGTQILEDPIKFRQKKSADLTIILPFRKTGVKVIQVIAGLKKFCDYPYHLLLINDASDNTFDFGQIANEYPGIKYLVNEKRLGLGGCWDKGVALADTEYVLLLDENIRISSDVLSPLMYYCKDLPESLVCLQSRLWTYGKAGCSYCLKSNPVTRGGAIDFSGIRGPMTLTWEFLNEGDGYKQSMEVPCVRGHAYCIKKDYYLYLHGCNGLIDGGYEDAFLSAKVWLQGGKCLLFRGTDIGHVYYPSVPWRDNSVALDFEKILFSRLFGGEYGGKLERAVRRHHSQEAMRIMDKYFDILANDIEAEKQYLSGIFTRTFKDLLNINRNDGNRIYP